MNVKRFQWVFIKDDELELRDNGIVKRFNNERLEELLNELHEENGQLQQQEKRLYKYFRKCFDNVSEQGFRETWEVVKKYD